MCMSRDVRGSLSWSDLPKDILLVIYDLLKSKYSNLPILNFRAVCKNWRSSVPAPFLRLHTLLPCTLSCLRRSDYPRLPVNSVHHDTPLVVVTTAVYILRQRCLHRKYSNFTNPWLVAVEQSNTLEPHKIRLCHPLTRLPIEEDVPCKNIIMSDFDAIKLSQGVNLRSMDATPLKYDYGTDDVYHVDKVILWPDPLHKSRQLKHYYVVVLYGKGKLACFRLDGCRDHKGISILIDGYADDIVVWKEKLWAVTRKGKLYGIDYNSMKVKYVVMVTSLEGNRRKRLFVDSNYDLYLLLAYQNCQQFKVFKLDSRHEWEKVVTLGDNILFVTFDSCFFASSQHFPGFRRNCIVYPKNCFPTYSGSRKSDDVLFTSASSGYLQVAVCKYEEACNFALISTFPRFSAVFWPPPQWISEPGPSSQVSASPEEHVSSAPRLEEQSTGIPLTSDARQKTTSHLLGSDKNQEEALNIISDDKVSGTDHASVTPVMASVELCEPSISFLQGLEIRSDLLVTLQIIWNKHGNIIGKSFMRSKGMLACALELLAKMTKDLQNTTLRTLTDDLAEEIGAIMSDLQLVGLKVDWLVPFVERVLDIQKNKPLIESIMAVDEEKARVEEEKEFLERNARKKQKLEEKRASMSAYSATLPVSEPIDLDQPLGEGLL